MKSKALIPILILLLLITAALSISLGAVHISIKQIFSVILGKEGSLQAYQIISFVRIPRTIAVVLTGSALAVSGAVLQSVLKNPLASPNIIGINSGAGLFTIIASVLLPHSIAALPLAAFSGALFSALIVCMLAFKTSSSKLTIIIAGVAVGSFLSAGTDLVMILRNDTVLGRINFTIGGFSGVSMSNIKVSGILIIIGLLLSLLLSYEMDILSLGDDTAHSLGLNVRLLRLIYIVLAALLAGCAVSIAGILGFVGLIVPNMVRYVIGSDNRRLIPVTMLTGAIFTLLCDILSRVLFAPYEIPVGIILSFLGAPFFIFLLFRQKGRARGD